jgi:hypothetical protein
MKTRVLTLGFACLLIGGFSLVLVQAAAARRCRARSATPRVSRRSGGIPAELRHVSRKLRARSPKVRRAPSIATLQEYSAERVYELLNKATTAPHAGNFSDLQKRQFAEFLSGRPMNSAAGDSKTMTNKCSSNPQLANPANVPRGMAGAQAPAIRDFRQPRMPASQRNRFRT